jgi:hypothetical protein
MRRSKQIPTAHNRPPFSSALQLDMPPQRNPKKTWGRPTGQAAQQNCFDPTQERIDEDVDEAQRTVIESDPYEQYHLKTGKHRGHTLKQLHDMKQRG